MRRYRLAIFVALLCGLGIAYYFWRDAPSASDAPPLLFRIDSNLINQIALFPCGQEPFLLIREGNRWIMGYQGVHQPAEPEKARQLVQQLAHIEVLGITGSGPAAWGEFGLQEGESLKVIVHTEGAEEKTLFFPCPTEQMLPDTGFARLQEESKVFQIRGGGISLLMQQPSYYRAPLDLNIPTDLSACHQVRIHARDSSWNLKSADTQQWADWLKTDSLSVWTTALGNLDLDAPYPFPEDPSPIWQIDFHLPEKELSWVSFYRDTVREMYYLESSSYSNLLFRIDSSLTYPAFLSSLEVR